MVLDDFNEFYALMPMIFDRPVMFQQPYPGLHQSQEAEERW